MKLMFASDIHGNAYFCNKLKEAYNKEQPEKLILLGDLLYNKSVSYTHLTLPTTSRV